MLGIGLPAGGEFALTFVYMLLVYDIIRPFGAAAQAGFGIGVRVMQCLLVPAVAVAFAATTVAGQNFGARLGSRVRLTFYLAAGMNAMVMLALTVPCQVAPGTLMRVFTGEEAVVSYGSEYLSIISWNFASTGVILVSSCVFQGIGNTLPALASSAQRVILFALPAYLISYRSSFELRHVWYLSVASVTTQLFVSVWLLRRELTRSLPAAEKAAAVAAA
jgi:Na+-driven multidrug efflux pump